MIARFGLAAGATVAVTSWVAPGATRKLSGETVTHAEAEYGALAWKTRLPSSPPVKSRFWTTTSTAAVPRLTSSTSDELPMSPGLITSRVGLMVSENSDGAGR
ncbi:hypothetical protein [Actinokineospora sp. NBRC 105648]|uniref:hypothetical protein n=1 Tax=Actinokineospora sp. NBRC 105648 TaxID=3032206 RepID=UPI0024A0C748|nr:hypothetical protein [Actinokineospora sp. NBRC 105648]GLZ42381.1 hypothetical protein Acsp05_60050 [Actinokineospora sp. NBRC 105648]